MAAAVDTGAAVCFVAPWLIGDAAAIGHHRDFYPGFGPFEADLHLVSIDLGGGIGPIDIVAAAAPPLTVDADLDLVQLAPRDHLRRECARGGPVAVRYQSDGLQRAAHVAWASATTASRSVAAIVG